MLDSHASKIIVFLVHGTWAGDADWTQDKSPFVSCLKTHLQPVKIEFRRFCWSGSNTHTHRLRAAEKLRGQLSQSLRDAPGLPHFIVGHSHGGSIACYALRDHDLRKAISGVICLGTPFLHMQRNVLPRSLLVVSLLWLGICSTIAVSYAFNPPEDLLVKWLVGATVVLVFPVLLLLVLTLWKGRGERFGLRSFLDFRRDPASYLKSLSFPTFKPEQFVAVRITGDEAAGVLVASQFFAWLFRAVWTRLAPAWEFFDRYRGVLAGSLGLVLLASFGATWLGVISEEWKVNIGGLVLIFLYVSGGVGIVIGLLAYATLVLLLLMHLPFAADAMFASFNVQTTAEPTPPGPATVYHVTPVDDATGSRHSELYKNSRVIDFVGDWIRDRLKPDGIAHN